MSELENVVLIDMGQAKRCLASARLLLADDDFLGATNRLYYCAFHCVRALLSNDNVNFKKHSGVISYFRREYIKTGKLNVQLSEIIGDLFDDRMGSDYDTAYYTDRETIEADIERAEYFYEEINNFLANAGKI